MGGTSGQRFAVVVGAVYVLIGLWGFLETGFDDVVATTDETLLVFGVNPLHNAVHVLLGAVWLVGSRTPSLARSVNLGLGSVLGLVTVLGLVGLLRFLAIGSLADPDNFLHLVTAAAALYVGSADSERAAA